MKGSIVFICATALLVCVLTSAFSQDNPACLSCTGSSSIESVVEISGITEEELLSRLVYAESSSTGYADNQKVYEAIAWGVMNRVRLGEAFPSMKRLYGEGIRGVIFKKGQFNPAVSKRSAFSREFLCPQNELRWKMASSAARKSIRGEGNPFIQTLWEKERNISLVVNFYYPCSVQAKTPLAPWESSKGLKFIGDVTIDGQVLPATQVRFYRLTRHPVDAEPLH